MVGKILNNRYKIIKEHGKGGMAIVYEAHDLLLDRKVALKMLRPEYASDKDFIKKFKHEAKAVARLSHPNVVSIFDIGREGNYHYLVMENIAGKDLKSLINERKKLSIAESLDIANQICSALIVAHKNNIIHCDIKPHNILINPDKQVKVTDFGIARAITSTTMTITDTIIGSAHYFSPEQARGGEIKTHSDLYSVGVVLYEMLTGEVPFKGDSPISVALKHIQKKPRKPSLLNSNIPEEVENIVMKALAKDPEARFQSAKEMRESIVAALKNLNSYNGDSDTTLIMSRNEDIKVLRKTDIQKKKSKINDKKIRKYLTEPDEKITKESKKWPIWLLIFLIFIGLSIAIFSVLYLKYMDVPVVEVPKIVGMDYKEGREVISQVGLDIEIQNEVFHSDIEKGKIISQFPVEGERVRQTRSIIVTVSKGARIIKLPDLRDKALRQAKIILENQKINIGEIKYVYDNDISENIIISQEPKPDSEIKSDENVNLVVSKGEAPNMVEVPNLIGLDRKEASDILKSSNLVIANISLEKTKRFKIGQVAKQEYKAGENIPENSKIDLTVSSGLINNKNNVIYTRRISYPIQGNDVQEISIVVIDDNGRDLIYKKLHRPGDKIVQIINSVGETRYEIYKDDLLVFEHEIKE